MDNVIAEKLLDALKRRPEIVTPDSKLFLEMLVSTNVPESSRFYEVLPDREQVVQETNRYHRLSLRRVLRNKNARAYQLGAWKRVVQEAISILGIYSSDALTRNLRANKELVGIMGECEAPFSLLGKFQTYDFDNPDETLFIITRPVLIIPGAKDTVKIHDWESVNTTYEKEVGLLLRHAKRIRPQEYLSQLQSPQ